MGLLERGAAWLQATIREAAGETVELSFRGSTTTIEGAIPGQTNDQRLREGDTTIQAAGRDWIIPRAAYRLDGVAVEPADFHRLTRTIAGSVEVYEVTSPDGQPCWSESDRYRGCYRIRTKLIQG